MPLDPSIALKTESPNPQNFISGFLDLGQKKLNLDKSRATFNADVSQRQAESALANTNADVAAQTAPARVSQANTAASLAKFQFNAEQAAKAMPIASGLISDPDFNPQSINPEGMVQKLNGAYDMMVRQFGIDPGIADANVTTLKYLAIHNPGQVRQALINMTQQQQSGAGQQAAAFPAPGMVNNGAKTFPVQMGAQALTGNVPGATVGQAIPNQVNPAAQEEIQSDVQGNRYVVQKSPDGVILGTRAVPGSSTGQSGQPAPGPVNLPPNETPASRDQLMTERNTAQALVRQAPEMHNINREVYNLADGGVQTGKLGGIINRVSSAFGFNVGADEAADYNTLGKYLARANAQLAQSMGLPNTNAGAEQANTAGGSPAYDKTSIKRIAVLNDALVTGSQMYQQGLERAIQTNGLFGKRQFDQQWSKTADVDAMAFKNAVDSKNVGQQQMILNKLGGKGSPGVRDMLDKLHSMRALVGDQ